MNNLAHGLTGGKTSNPVAEKIGDVVAGYVDGLIGVDIRAQKDACSDSFGNAQN